VSYLKYNYLVMVNNYLVMVNSYLVMVNSYLVMVNNYLVTVSYIVQLPSDGELPFVQLPGNGELPIVQLPADGRLLNDIELPSDIENLLNNTKEDLRKATEKIVILQGCLKSANEAKEVSNAKYKEATKLLQKSEEQKLF